MALMRSYVNAGGGALLVLHDVDLAARYADRLLWLRDGQLVADGPVDETLTTVRMAEVYGVRAIVEQRSVQVLGEL